MMLIENILGEILVDVPFAVGECVCRWNGAFAVGDNVCRWNDELISRLIEL